MFFFFFFSSRRRHTRSTRDWSSDVCSSDLAQFHAAFANNTFQFVRQAFDELARIGCLYGAPQLRVGRAWFPHQKIFADRSEERRVGKECRSRRSAVHLKKEKVNHMEQSRRY